LLLEAGNEGLMVYIPPLNAKSLKLNNKRTNNKDHLLVFKVGFRSL
jgi:hypothetical protein